MEEEEEDKTGSPYRREKSAAEMRKINKPLMERKRRERINNCLNQLKLFLMEATKKDSSYYSKLEKADILEMTVKYLKNLQRQQMAVALATDPKVASKYSAGYSQCANEVTRFLNKVEGFQPDMRNRLVNHLTNCVHKVNQDGTQAPTPVVQMSLPQSQPIGLQMASSATISQQQQQQQQQPLELQLGGQLAQVTSTMSAMSGSSGPVLVNSTMAPSSGSTGVQGVQNVPVLPVQLIPAKLPGGEFVLLMANTQSVPTVTNLVSPMTIQLPGTSVSTASNAVAISGAEASMVTAQANIAPIITHPSAASTAAGLGGSAIAVVPPQVQEPKTDYAMTKPINLSMPSKTGTKPSSPEFEPVPGPSSGNCCDRGSFLYRPRLNSGKQSRASPPHTVSRPDYRVDDKPGQCEHEQGQGHNVGPEVNPNVYGENPIVYGENMWRPW